MRRNSIPRKISLTDSIGEILEDIEDEDIWDNNNTESTATITKVDMPSSKPPLPPGRRHSLRRTNSNVSSTEPGSAVVAAAASREPTLDELLTEFESDDVLSGPVSELTGKTKEER